MKFADYLPQIQSVINEAIELCGKNHPKHDPLWNGKIEGLQSNLTAKGDIRIALIGEFSAGKSALIAALTGKEVFIDADVATNEIAEYHWKGTVIVYSRHTGRRH